MDFIFRNLRTILHEKFSFHYDQIQPETHLELELGMDSREMFELLEELEESFNITFDLDEIDEMFQNNELSTIENLINYLKKKTSFV
jgi:acyl carrier protein